MDLRTNSLIESLGNLLKKEWKRLDRQSKAERHFSLRWSRPFGGNWTQESAFLKIFCENGRAIARNRLRGHSEENWRRKKMKKMRRKEKKENKKWRKGRRWKKRRKKRMAFKVFQPLTGILSNSFHLSFFPFSIWRLIVWLIEWLSVLYSVQTSWFWSKLGKILAGTAEVS